jgi:hypothetical protein
MVGPLLNMPSHQKRREPLPKGYQFGDAGKPRIAIRFVKQYDIKADTHPTRIPALSPDFSRDQPFAPGLTLRAQGEWNG